MATVAFASTIVVEPELVLASEPANRSAFSQPTIPDQLSTKWLPAIRRLSPYGPETRLSLPDSDR